MVYRIPCTSSTVVPVWIVWIVRKRACLTIWQSRQSRRKLFFYIWRAFTDTVQKELKIIEMTKVRGSWNFGFLGEVKIFLISRGVVLWGGIFLWGRSVHSTSIFPFWNARFQKFKNFRLRRPHFQFLHFQI